YCAGVAVTPPSAAGRIPPTTPLKRPATISPTATYSDRYRKCFTVCSLPRRSDADRALRQERPQELVGDGNHDQRRERRSADDHERGLAVIFSEHLVHGLLLPRWPGLLPARARRARNLVPRGRRRVLFQLRSGETRDL